MADKKLNEVSQLTDFDYALVVKGNDVAKVTKQQLATLLGELIGIKKVKKTIIATLEGSIIYSEGGTYNSQAEGRGFESRLPLY